MSRTPDNPSQDVDIDVSVRQLLSDGVKRADVVKKIVSDFNISESTARRKVRELEKVVEESEFVTNKRDELVDASKSRIVRDIMRLEWCIESCIDEGNFGEIGKLQSAKTALYKLHFHMHPELVWSLPEKITRYA